MNGARLDLYWIPLGAGPRVVPRSGRCYERLVAWRQHRTPRDLYHSALIATTSHGPVVARGHEVHRALTFPAGVRGRDIISDQI